MDTITNLCFLCTKDYKCVPVDDNLVSQVEYLFPEITIFKLGIPLRICSMCDGALYAFSKFKQFYVESIQRLEACIKGAQGPSLYTANPLVVNDSDTSECNSECSFDCSFENFSFSDEHSEETPLDTPIHSNTTFLNPVVMLERLNIVPHNQLQEDRVSQNIQLHTDTNDGNTKYILINEDQLDVSSQNQECFNDTVQNIIKEECANNSVTKHNKADKNVTLKTSEEVSAGYPVDLKKEIDKNYTKNTHITRRITREDNLKPKIQITKEYECGICFKSFVGKSLLIHHMKTTHRQIINLTCIICKKIFINKHDLNKHIELHNNFKKFQCALCKRRYSSKNNLRRHEKVHTKTSFRCEKCDITFTSRSGLKSHRKTHGTVQIPCSKCNKLFNHKKELEKHMKSHYGIKDSQCDACGKSFKFRSNLLRHIKSHSGIKDFECKICSKSFMQKTTLINHLKTHSGIKDFKCDFCDKSFSQKAGLDTHKKIHYGVKDFHCDICNKSYMQKSHLTRHMAIHVEIRTVTCGICNNLFAFNGNNELMERYLENDELQCDVCRDKISRTSICKQ